jgi:hypothetical protein
MNPEGNRQGVLLIRERTGSIGKPWLQDVHFDHNRAGALDAIPMEIALSLQLFPFRIAWIVSLALGALALSLTVSGITASLLIW